MGGWIIKYTVYLKIRSDKETCARCEEKEFLDNLEELVRHLKSMKSVKSP